LAIYAAVILSTTILLLSTVVAGMGVSLAKRILSQDTSPWELEEALKRSRWDSPEYRAAQSRAQQIQRTAANGQTTAVLALPEFWRVWLLAVPKWIIVAAVCAVLWPGATLLALLVFQTSMRRARIRSGHIARTIVYCADVVTWTVPLFVLLSMADWLLRGLRRPWNWPDVYWYAAADNPAGPVIGTILTSPTSLVLLLGLLLGTYRLCTAYRLYLRFDQPVLTVLLSQAVTALVAIQLAAMTTWL